MNFALDLYRLALGLYPSAFRERYAAEMLGSARQLAADAPNKSRFAAALAWDTFLSLVREHMRLASPLKPIFLFAFAVFFSVLLLAVSVFHQQVLRRGADRQPEQLATTLSEQLAHSDNRSLTLPGPTQDLGSRAWLGSNATFAAVYDASGQVVASNATFDSALPQPPRGIFSTIRARGLYKVTWQPQRGVRIALTGREISGGGFVLAGQSLLSAEARTARFDLFLKLMWAVLLLACGTILVLAKNQRRMRTT
jgi:hypothetical protein